MATHTLFVEYNLTVFVFLKLSTVFKYMLSVSGLGFCFVYVPSHVMSGLYYDKHTSLATGVATAGSGLGMTVFPTIVGYLIDVYTWRGSLIILAGLMLNLFVFGLLLRPLPQSKKTRDEDETMLENIGENDQDKGTKGKRFRNYLVFCVFEFDVFFVGNILWNMGLNIVVTFGPDFILTSLGVTSIEAAYMLTVLGLCTFLGSLLTGFIGNFHCVNRLFLYVLVCVLSGFGVICFPVAKTYVMLMAAHAVVGLGFGGILGLLLVLTTDLLGPESLGDGVGYLMLSNGVGCFAGPPIAGNYHSRAPSLCLSPTIKWEGDTGMSAVCSSFHQFHFLCITRKPFDIFHKTLHMLQTHTELVPFINYQSVR